MKPVIAITGGTGFLGRHVIQHFLDQGSKLKLLVRQPEKVDWGLPAEQTEKLDVIKGSLSDKEALARLVDGADVIVHMAGLIKARRPIDFEKSNVDGTRNLIDVFNAHNAKAGFIFVSSMAAREPTFSPYSSSKAAAEKVVLEHIDQPIILRPSAIYGPGDEETLPLFKATRLPFQPALNGKKARVCLVHVTDVAEAIGRSALHLFQKGSLQGTYEVSDERYDGYLWQEIIEAACLTCGQKARPFHVPPFITKVLGRFGDLQAAITRSAVMLTSYKTAEVLHEDWSSNESAQLPHEIWQARIALPEGFENTVQWYRDHKKL